MRKGSESSERTVSRGLKDPTGSWNIAPTSRRNAFSARGPMPTTSRPRKRMLPSRGRSRPMMLLASVVLPDPLSPTSPKVSASPIVSETPATASMNASEPPSISARNAGLTR